MGQSRDVPALVLAITESNGRYANVISHVMKVEQRVWLASDGSCWALETSPGRVEVVGRWGRDARRC